MENGLVISDIYMLICMNSFNLQKCTEEEDPGNFLIIAESIDPMKCDNVNPMSPGRKASLSSQFLSSKHPFYCKVPGQGCPGLMKKMKKESMLDISQIPY